MDGGNPVLRIRGTAQPQPWFLASSRLVFWFFYVPLSSSLRLALNGQIIRPFFHAYWSVCSLWPHGPSLHARKHGIGTGTTTAVYSTVGLCGM